MYVFIESPTDVRHPLKGEVRRFVVIFMYIPIHTYLRSARAPPRLFDWGTDSKAPKPTHSQKLVSPRISATFGIQAWINESRGGGTRPWGPRGKGSLSVSKGPKPPIQLLQWLKNSPRQAKRVHFRYILVPRVPPRK